MSLEPAPWRTKELPYYDPTINCHVCGCPMKWSMGGYIHDWSKATQEQKDAANSESGM